MSGTRQAEGSQTAPPFKPYPAYKDTGVEWLGKIPAHWTVARVSELTVLLNGYPFNSEFFTRGEGTPLVRIRDLNAGATEVNYIGPLVENVWIQPGDVIIGMDGDFNVARWRGQRALLNQRMCCLRPRSRTDSEFIAYLLPFPLQVINDLTYSTTVKHLSSGDVRKVRLGAPPALEQHAIAAFLDRETARINALVAKKERLVELLQEQRTAVITRAVTKGLDPTVRMKDSGVEWLGEIPAHWQVKRLKHVSLVENSGTYGAEPGESAVDLPVCTTAHLTADGHFLVDDMPLRGFSALEAGYYVGAPGDIFIVKSSGSNTNIISGKLGLVAETTPKVVFSNFLMRIRPSGKSVSPEFLAYLLRSELTRERIQRMVATTTYPNIDVSEYVGSAFAIPAIGEQERIAATLNRETARIDALVTKVRYAMDRLKELRTALISAAVTGKIDVREVA